MFSEVLCTYDLPDLLLPYPSQLPIYLADFIICQLFIPWNSFPVFVPLPALTLANPLTIWSPCLMFFIPGRH